MIDNFESESIIDKNIDPEVVIGELINLTEKLSSAIQTRAETFDKRYNNEDEMLHEIKIFFEKLNSYIEKITMIFIDIKTNLDDTLSKLLALKYVEKILCDYLIWCEKLENAILGLGSTEVIFKPDVKIENRIFSYASERLIKHNDSWLLPFVGGIGLGFLLDDG